MRRHPCGIGHRTPARISSGVIRLPVGVDNCWRHTLLGVLMNVHSRATRQSRNAELAIVKPITPIMIVAVGTFPITALLAVTCDARERSELRIAFQLTSNYARGKNIGSAFNAHMDEWHHALFRLRHLQIKATSLAPYAHLDCWQHAHIARIHSSSPFGSGRTSAVLIIFV